MANPQFVRLSDHMTNGLCVDRETQWSISGMDVKPFPEARQEARFVRRKLNAGILEAASQAEHEEVHPEEYDDGESDDEREAQRMVELVSIAAGNRKVPTQEHKLRQKESSRTEGIRAARFKAKLEEEGIEVEDDADFDEMAYESERARRQAILEDAEEATDDPAEQKERTATRARKATKSAKKAAKRSADPVEPTE